MKENGNGAKALGSRIRFARKKNGLNQEKLAELLEMTTSSVGSYEVGKSYPSVEALTKIGKVLNVSFDWLLKGEGETDYQLETVSNKPADQGSFGSQVEDFLRQQLAEKDQQIKSLLKIIENGGLGKDKVTEYLAAVFGKTTGSVTSQREVVQTIALR